LLECPDLSRLRVFVDWYGFALVVDDTIGNLSRRMERTIL